MKRSEVMVFAMSNKFAPVVLWQQKLETVSKNQNGKKK
jgi:hypothetical protein